ncbi:MAG: Inositol-1-monophosphatase [Candidatus Pacebacteria bacterium GW2011_GWB1_47_8]|nr:MAG: Inositol-1-monophosphatase [Candidatus Pacebacteria bacterium GW2011_GWA1_46_10]KKU84715.1 MAG: Inositol-1-monophosphatase [Candidatus Pacebacteria bacterium GW2011_GWB1_47_8]
MSDSALVKVAIEAAKKAAVVIRQNYLQNNEVYDKKPTDLMDYVTKVDKQAEEVISRTIKELYPDHSIWGEESGKNPGKGEYTWVIDPIDGTKNFVRGLPQFVTSIGVLKNQEPVVGVIFDPIDMSYVWAVKGLGAYIGERKPISNVRVDIKSSSIAINFGKTVGQRKRTLGVFKGILEITPIVRMLGSTAYVVKGMTEGKFDALIDTGDYWDYAAGLVIAKEAGFHVSEWNGNEVSDKSDFIFWSRNELQPILFDILKKL